MRHRCSGGSCWLERRLCCFGFAHGIPARSSSSLGWGFVALSVSALHAERVKPGTFFALGRELLSLAQRK